jgi:hypothetical protein
MTRMELSLELNAPMMRDFVPPGAMPFHPETKFIWQTRTRIRQLKSEVQTAKASVRE